MLFLSSLGFTLMDGDSEIIIEGEAVFEVSYRVCINSFDFNKDSG